ncbi:MAG: hypothetical protein ACKOPO_07975 [Novosphingobium sp.]
MIRQEKSPDVQTARGLMMRRLFIVAAALVIATPALAKSSSPRPTPTAKVNGKNILFDYTVGKVIDAGIDVAKGQWRCRNNVTYPQGRNGTVANSTPAVMVCNNPN